MNNRYLSSEVNINRIKNNPINLSKLSLKEINFSPEKGINIVNYLKELEKQNTIIKKEKFNFKLLPKIKPQSSFLNRVKLNKSVDINNILSLKNENNNCNNNDNGCFLTSLEIENNDDNKIEINNEKNKNENVKDKILKTYKNKRNLNRNYNLASIIKDIKRKNSSYVSRTEGNYFNENIAYDNKNLKVILDINDIINKYLKNEEWNLKEREEKYKDFVNTKKSTCLKNILMKLMKKEREKINNRYIKYSFDFDNKINAIREGEKMFDKIVVDQKKSTKLIEDNYYKLKDNNKILRYLRENFKEQVRKTEYDLLKKIYEIDELRIYAQFVNYIYGNDTSLYEKPIIDIDYNKNPSDTETLINNVLEDYKLFLKDDYDGNINSIDPDIVFNEIVLIEDRILMNLKLRDQEYEDLKKYKNNNRNILKNIETKKIQLEEVYNNFKKELDAIIINTDINLEEDLFSLSKELGLFILETLSEDKKQIKKYTGQLNLFEICDLAAKSLKYVLKKESVLDYYIKILEKYDEEDKKTFSLMINKRKEELIREKTKQAKKNVERQLLFDKFEIQKNSEKIYFIKRKNLPTIPKKKKKIIKLDPEIIRQNENKELISYE